MELVSKENILHDARVEASNQDKEDPIKADNINTKEEITSPKQSKVLLPFLEQTKEFYK